MLEEIKAVRLENPKGEMKVDIDGGVRIIDKPLFLKNIGEEAENLGVDIVKGCTIESVNELDAEYIVDASGIPSKIRKEMGLKHHKLLTCFQYRIRDCSLYEQGGPYHLLPGLYRIPLDLP